MNLGGGRVCLTAMAAYSEAVPQTGVRALAKGLMPRTLVIRRLPDTAAPSVLLTFDDGPHPDVTAGVLDRLAAHDAKAVFFVVGRRLKRGGDLLARMRREGQVIGNHSYLHRNRYVLPVGPQATLLEYLPGLRAVPESDPRAHGRRGAPFPAAGRPAEFHDDARAEAAGHAVRHMVAGCSGLEVPASK